LTEELLVAIVFGDPRARHDWTQIVHLTLREAMNRWFASLDPARSSFALAEFRCCSKTGRERNSKPCCDGLRASTQLERLMKRDGLTREEAAQRMCGAVAVDDKIALADSSSGRTEPSTRRIVRLTLLRLDYRRPPSTIHHPLRRTEGPLRPQVSASAA